MKEKTIIFAASFRTMLDLLAKDCPCIRLLLAAVDAHNAVMVYDNYFYCVEPSPGRLIRRRRTAPRHTLAKELPGNYFAWREKDGMVSFSKRDADRPEVNEHGQWLREGRQSMKAGRWLRAMFSKRLNERIPDALIEKFTNRFRSSEAADTYRVELWESVGDAYESAHWRGDLKDQMGSCMAGDPVGEFYSNYPVSVAVLLDGRDKVCGRALVWNAHCAPPRSNGDGMRDITFMDRVYAPDHLRQMFFDHARQHGWYFKSNQCAGEVPLVTPGWDGREPMPNLDMSQLTVRQLHNEQADASYYPYLDTLAYADEDGRLRSRETSDTERIYHSTCGDYSSTNRVTLHDGTRCIAEDAIEIDGVWYHRDDVVWVEADQQYHREEDVVYVGRYRQEARRVNDEDVVVTANHGHQLVDDCVEVDGDWYRTDDSEICWVESSEEYELAERCVTLHDGESALLEDAIEIGDQWYLKDDCSQDDDGNWLAPEDDDGNWLAPEQAV